MALKIFGAGMAGLLAAHILRRHDPVVFEAQPELPNNHKALLRFRSPVVSEVTGIPFKRVKVQKGIYTRGELKMSATLADSNRYSLKVIGAAHPRSILSLEPSERYIAPENFIEQLAAGLDIKYNVQLSEEEVREHDGQIVSTIPMPALMSLMGFENQFQFKSMPIWTVNGRICNPDVELYQTVYFPDDDTLIYRVSICGNILIIEYIGDPHYIKHGDHIMIEKIFGLRGLAADFSDPKRQTYGKILPIDDDARRAFILMATDRYHIYSVGRFATWRQILLDDVVKDCKFVDTMLNQRDRYATKFLTATR